MRLRTALVLAILFFFTGGTVDVYGGPPRKPPSQRPAVKKPLKKPAAKPVTKPTAKPAAKKPAVNQRSAAQKPSPKKSAGSQKPGAQSANKTASGAAAGQRRTASGIKGGNSSGGSTSRPKPVNLPSWRKVKVDIGHISDRHMKGGPYVNSKKDLFPESMSRSQVEAAVREAYRSSKKVFSQGDRFLLRGRASGLVIEMWLNQKSKKIETAYPVS